MTQLSFPRPTPSRDLVAVFLDGVSVGLVWREGAIWYADPKSTANPLVTAADKEDALEGLLEEQGFEVPK